MERIRGSIERMIVKESDGETGKRRINCTREKEFRNMTLKYFLCVISQIDFLVVLYMQVR